MSQRTAGDTRSGTRGAVADGAGAHRILIVDDDRSIVQLLSEILTDEGYAVATATQSLRAFERAKEFAPDLILMDVMMPYLDGLDQLRLFSLDAELRAIPAIVVTAKTHALDGIADPGALGIVDHVDKPFDTATLLGKIRTALAARRP